MDIVADNDGDLREGTYVIFISADDANAVVTCEIDNEAPLEELCESETTDGELVVEAAPSCAGDDCGAHSISMMRFRIYVPAGTEGGNPNFAGPEHVDVEVNMVGEAELLGSASYDPRYDRINYKGAEGCGWCDASQGRSTLSVSYPELFGRE